MTIEKTLPSVEFLESRLSYDPETGIFLWKERAVEDFKCSHDRAAWNGRYANKPAGTLNDSGYSLVVFRPLKGRFRLHRIAWKMVHGVDPVEIDHINGIRTDNRLVNLRSVDRTINGRNVAPRAVRDLPMGIRRTREGYFQARVGEIARNARDLPSALAKLSALRAARGYHPNHGRGA
jgi:hypothetical protein